MLRLYLTILIALSAASASWAEETEAEEPGADSPAAEEAAAIDEVTDEEIDELLGLDEDWADAEDDDFNPTEEVRFEQNIAFPVDI